MSDRPLITYGECPVCEKEQPFYYHDTHIGNEGLVDVYQCSCGVKVQLHEIGELENIIKGSD